MGDGVIELKVLSVSRCTQDGGAYMAVLKERGGVRIMPVLMEWSDAFQLLMKMKDATPSSLPANMADIMRAAFLQSGMSVEEVRISAVQAGMTYCHILYRENTTARLVRYCKASDGLILAYTFNCPITIHETLFEQQYMREVGDGSYSMPVNSVNIEALKEALKRAVEDENYELASQLRDEINRRK